MFILQFVSLRDKLTIYQPQVGRKQENMNCRFCGAELEREEAVCPFCGKTLLEENTPDEQVTVETQEVACECEKKSKKKWPFWKWALSIGGAVIFLGALAVALLVAMGVDILPRENDIYNKDSYVVSNEKAEEKAKDVVAEINGKGLTNAQLQIHYKMQVQDFLNYYGSYLSEVGFDYTKPLSGQKCYMDDKLTWEQYFLKMALETWQNYQTVALLAEEAKFELSAQAQEELAALPEGLEEQAKENEYASAEAMVQEILGAGCTVQDYVDYVKIVTIATEFYNKESERLTPTEKEIEEYFNEYEATFEEAGITKDGGLVSSVRHILISPEGGTLNEDTNETTYSEKEWNTAKKKAEKLLKQWKNGKATEESFAALVKDNTDDTGSAETGGLYENITPVSSYVPEFLAWAIDMSRKTGDTGIVKTEYGYHIMYFVSGEPYWMQEAGTMLLSDRTTAMIDDAEAKWPMKVNYNKIILTELELG